MRSNTATGTTATADAAVAAVRGAAPNYRGRFAPSPTGLLHQGSLLAAVASWLDARAHAGVWLVRIEDLDTPRVLPGATEAILETLQCFGLEPDEPPLHQSQRTDAYREALGELIAQGLAYRCRCSRSELATAGTCRCHALQLEGEDCAWRLRLPPETIRFEDRIQGHCSYAASLLGDPVLRRRDGLYAYQLAVAVDDAFQGITDIVRGADLLESTAWQIAVGQALGLPAVRYSHIPLLTEPDGSKLAKSRRSLPLAQLDPAAALAESLRLLGITLPQELKAASVSDMLHWSVQHWSPVRIAGTRAIPLPH